MIGEACAAFGADAAGVPGGLAEQSDFGAADGFEGGEAVLDLGDERSGVFGVEELAECERRCETRWRGGTPGMPAPGASGSGAMEMEWTRPRSTMLRGMPGVVAVAQGGEDVGFGDGECGHGCWSDDSLPGSRFQVPGSRF